MRRSPSSVSVGSSVLATRCLTFSVAFLLCAVTFATSSYFFDPGLKPKFLGLMAASLPIAFSGWALRNTKAFHCRILDIPIAIYVFSVVVQWPRAFDVYQASIEVAKAVTLLTVYRTILGHSTPYQWRLWIRILVILGSAVSVVGILQYFGLAFLDLPSAGFPNGTFAYRNTAAMFVIMVLPYAMFQFCTSRARDAEVLNAIALTVCSTFVIYTRTRGAWVGWLAAILCAGVIAFAWRRDFRIPRFASLVRSRKAAILVVALVTTGFLGSLVPSKAMTRAPQAGHIPREKKTVTKAIDTVIKSASSLPTAKAEIGSGRVGRWLDTARMIADHPWTGVGLTNWEKIYPLYGPPVDSRNRISRRPHNDYLWVWSESGVLGFAAYVAMFLSALMLVLRMSAQNRYRSIALASLAAITAIQAHALFSFPRERVGPLTIEWCVIGILAAVGRQPLRTRASYRSLAPIPSFLLVLLSATVALRSSLSEAMTATGIASVGEAPQQALKFVEVAGDLGVYDYKHLMYHADVFAQTGRLEEAYAACVEVSKRHPNSVNGLQNLGQVSRALYRYEDAKTAYSRAIEIGPRRVVTYQGLGLTYEDMGEDEKALKVYGVGQSDHPTVAWFAQRIGDVYYRKNGFEEAVVAFTRATNLDTTSIDAILKLGNARMRLGEITEALAAYTRGLELDPENAATHYAVGGICASRSDARLARHHLELAIRFSEDPDLTREAKDLLRRIEGF
ncbi:tetratricopeptide repeat protein [bacterium]|nr:tetratricopeptide repeat protein [bacterium]